MATEKATPEVKVNEQPVVESFDMTLTEFCIRLSTEKVGPEMISGFHHSQNAKGVIKASSADFRAAFDRYTRQPA